MRSLLPRFALLLSLGTSAATPAAQAQIPQPVPPTPARVPRTMNVEQAIRQAVEHNVSLRGAAAAVSSAEAAQDLARARLLPHVDVSETFVRTDHPMLAFGARLAQERVGPANLNPDALNSPDAIHDWATRLEANIPVMDASAWYGLSAAEEGHSAARAAQRTAEARIIAGTVAAYYRVQLAKAERALVQEMAAAADADLQRTSAAERAGTSMAADVAGLQTEVAQFREEHIRAEGALEVAQAELAHMLGLQPQQLLRLSSPLAPARKTANPSPETPAADHPELAQTEAGLAAAQAQQSEAWARFAPTLAVFGALEHHAPRFLAGGGANYLVGVALKLNLLAGGADTAAVRQAQAAVAQAKALAADSRAQLQLKLVRARRALKDAEALIDVTEQAREFARESHRLERVRFDSGMSQSADVMRSRSALLLSERRHLGALYSKHVAAVQLAYATGTLDRSYGGTQQ